MVTQIKVKFIDVSKKKKNLKKCFTLHICFNIQSQQKWGTIPLLVPQNLHFGAPSHNSSIVSNTKLLNLKDGAPNGAPNGAPENDCRVIAHVTKLFNLKKT